MRSNNGKYGDDVSCRGRVGVDLCQNNQQLHVGRSEQRVVPYHYTGRVGRRGRQYRVLCLGQQRTAADRGDNRHRHELSLR